ncbi:restriction endonuclease subunit S [Flavobacterium sp. xlx-214]|uniref:restriction endonuclease subunit S n=1 Tax=unclassified Flavobacterium TaxID=196869 RepID=UPI0013D2702E|nr:MULTISPECIES: restriction endonuclease subunit S [unclassified Flavobacterium]MBA5791674.1 restriction endonuclease subunit S [Flavobacterium sp. xlx-221]QMI82917.1 restriction endonuclease subunit S [Flavobacterium sp. xlx-214]
MMEKQLQPKLRFPEFEGDLKNIYLKDIAEFSKGKNISKSDIVEDGVFECIRYGELYTTYNEVINEIVSKTNIDEKNLIFSEANDIIIPASGESALDIATASCVIRDGVALGGDLNIIKTKENGIFLSYYFNNKKKYEIAKKSQGISVIHIYSDHLKSLNLNIPSLPEQQKIADYLATIDTKINLLEEKKEQLSLYKKAMMQKLFSQEIRFKNDKGNDFPEWEEKRLGEIGEIVTGKTPDTTNKSLWNGNIQFITPSDLNDEVKYIDFTERTVVKLDKMKILPMNTIVFTCIASIGKMALTKMNSITNQQINSLLPVNQINDFIYYALLNITPYIKSTQANTTLPIINKTEFSKFKINIPSLPEQQKIAEFLSAIDESIAKVNEQITQTQSFKKAMLQQMFV